MAKTKIHYLCRECGGVQTRWMGKCPDCGVWDALDRFVEPKLAASSEAGAVPEWIAGTTTGPVPLPEIERADVPRLATGIGEFDRVLGGGFVPGSVVLLGGEPGIGKSTLLLQGAARLAASGAPILYVTSEESAYQTRLRAERLVPGAAEAPGGLDGLGSLYVLAETNLAHILEVARKLEPKLLVLDSIQLVHRGDLDAAPGSPAQIRRCCMDLVAFAKVTGQPMALVGHVTKDGAIAGPKMLEHLVDAVLSFEGDRHHAYRVVRGIKNRYGTTLEVGLFEMTGQGLLEITDGGALRLDDAPPRAGAVLCPVMQGTRSILVEVQALTAPTFPGGAKRKASGLDLNRLNMLVAVLEQHGGLRLADQDVFASTVGGLRITDPGADLALALAIAGSHLRRRLPAHTAVIGEVGLGGEVRPVHQFPVRVAEAVRQGARCIVAPVGGEVSEEGVDFFQVRFMGAAVDILERDPNSVKATQVVANKRDT